MLSPSQQRILLLWVSQLIHVIMATEYLAMVTAINEHVHPVELGQGVHLSVNVRTTSSNIKSLTKYKQYI